MEPVTIKGLTFGAGLPKICVPLTAPTLPKLIAEAENAAAHRGKDADLCEWRVDSYIYRNTAAVREAFWNLRQVLKGMPLLVTLRTKSEGGGADCTGEGYLYRIEELIRLRPDLIDIELLTAGGPATRAVWEAHQAGVKVVLSSHDFNRTPSAAGADPSGGVGAGFRHLPGAAHHNVDGQARGGQPALREPVGQRRHLRHAGGRFRAGAAPRRADGGDSAPAGQ